MGVYRYPLDAYAGAWKSFKKQMELRMEAHRKDSGVEVIVSTAVFWCLPAWVTSYNDIYLFIRNNADALEADADPALLQEIAEEFALK